MKGKKIFATVVVLTFLMSTMVVMNVLDVYVLEKAGAQPGVDAYGNATIDLKYDTSYADGSVKINTSATSIWSTGTYYLYFPIYVSSGAGPNADSFTWSGPYKVGGASVKVVSTNSDNDALDTGGSSISFNRSGMWIFDDDSSHNATNTSTYAGYIWVNTSADYVISSVADFKYNSSGSKTITVDTGDDSGSMISIINPDNTTTYHKWRSTGASEAIGIKGNFTMVGDYTIQAYRDFDEDSDVYLYSDGETNYENYSNTYGNGASFPADASYSYSNQGPFDPPEKNATETTFTVETGEPIIVMTNDTNIYWGFELKMEINVTDEDGEGIANGTIRLKKDGTYISHGDYEGIWMVEDSKIGNYTLNISRYVAGSTQDWANLANGTWRVVFHKDINADGTDEWNNSERISIKSTSPPVRITIDNDGSGKSTDKKVNVPAYTGDGDDAADTTNISFTIMGRSIADDEGRAYYGDDTGEDYKNVTISGDMLYPITLYGGSQSGTLINNGDGTWNAVVTPSMPGGEITIEIDWPGNNNGTDSETIQIINGTEVTTSVDKFTIGEHINLTVTIKDMDGDFVKTSRVYLFWKGGGANSDINDTTGNNNAGKGQNGEYTFWIKPSEQGNSAPENITIAASWPRGGTDFWGYATVRMEKNHNMIVNCTPTTAYGGDAVEYDIDVSLLEGGTPDKNGLTVAIYNETGAEVTGDDAWSKTGSYDINDVELILSGGTYYIHAYNDTHDSQGYNATIIVTAYSVLSSPTVLAWLIDTETNMTFQVTPAGNGTLTINNMSSTPNASHLGEAEGIEIENGVGTLDEVNATTLGNITFSYQPEDGEDRPATGIVHITTATAVPNPATVYIGEPTIVEITVTHPATGEPLKDIIIGLDSDVSLNESLSTLLIKIPDEGNTDGQGKVWFSIETGGSGNVTIFVENETDPDNPFVIKSAARAPMTITVDPSVNEGFTFTVTAKSRGTLITDATISIEFAGETFTTTDGTLEITAPDVPTTLDYMVTATAEGYTSDDAMIKIIDIPQLTIVVSGTDISAGSQIEVIVADDDGNAIIGATITINNKEYKTGAQGKAAITVPSEKGTYTIDATFPGYGDADTVTIKVTEGGIPGFELLTLIAALGVAFILLRRRRN